MSTASFHVLIGWWATLLGIVSGAVIGLFFHREAWAGGYSSFRRRMLRLGHIAFFGLGFVNWFFGFTLQNAVIAQPNATIASYGFLVGVITMPLCCFLTAWARPFRHFFAVPVLSVLAGVTAVLTGWSAT